jgi:hypothetical protein
MCPQGYVEFDDDSAHQSDAQRLITDIPTGQRVNGGVIAVEQMSVLEVYTADTHEPRPNPDVEVRTREGARRNGVERRVVISRMRSQRGAVSRVGRQQFSESLVRIVRSRRRELEQVTEERDVDPRMAAQHLGHRRFTILPSRGAEVHVAEQ